MLKKTEVNRTLIFPGLLFKPAEVDFATALSLTAKLLMSASFVV